jgi:hypothetical protein
MDVTHEKTSGQATERLIITKIAGRFTVVGVPRCDLTQPHFFLRTEEDQEGPMTFLQCRVRLYDHLADRECDLVERLPATWIG